MIYPPITSRLDYKRLCLWAQYYKHCYYVTELEVTTDQHYDGLERAIAVFEKENNLSKYKYSPSEHAGVLPDGKSEYCARILLRYYRTRNLGIYERIKI